MKTMRQSDVLTDHWLPGWHCFFYSLETIVYLQLNVPESAFSTLPLNRPATVEGSVGKGAWCGRCWAMDTGPQKESDTPQEAGSARQKETARGRPKEKGISRPDQKE